MTHQTKRYKKNSRNHSTITLPLWKFSCQCKLASLKAALHAATQQQFWEVGPRNDLDRWHQFDCRPTQAPHSSELRRCASGMCAAKLSELETIESEVGRSFFLFFLPIAGQQSDMNIIHAPNKSKLCCPWCLTYLTYVQLVTSQLVWFGVGPGRLRSLLWSSRMSLCLSCGIARGT